MPESNEYSYLPTEKVNNVWSDANEKEWNDKWSDDYKTNLESGYDVLFEMDEKDLDNLTRYAG